MKTKTRNSKVFGVVHTTESGADYFVKTGLKDVHECNEWITENREKFPRPLMFKRIR